MAKLIPAGTTDSGKPLHVFVIDAHRDFDPVQCRKRGKAILLINNAIHPGEPCGVDASILLAKELLGNTSAYQSLLNNVTIVIIPMLNVDGALNRSPYNRANQNGPREQGFRANARNMDLNRDMIKADTRNIRSFISILRMWDPDVFIDTHTSNGADYPYILTLIATEKNKFSTVLSPFLHDEMVPALYHSMEDQGWPMVPYVETLGRSPESGIIAFMDGPRYTTGYVSLFNTLAFTTEAHMHKPYALRVEATYCFIRTAAAFTADNKDKITRLRREAAQAKLLPRQHYLGWQADTTRKEYLEFTGYEVKERISKVTETPIHYYDSTSVWNKLIPWYAHYYPTDSVVSPKAWIVPQAWEEVIERLKLNHVIMTKLHGDTLLKVNATYIADFKTSAYPYNGHYYHYAVETRQEEQMLQFYRGDYLIPFSQPASEFLVQVLEPKAGDSYFNWNFFDGILSRKEYFSPYVFDKLAEALLQEDEALRTAFSQKRESDEQFRNNGYEQLRFIYERSPYGEKGYMRYPVYRIEY